jgi:uncharacterized repeat protein (TIGR03803 family)
MEDGMGNRRVWRSGIAGVAIFAVMAILANAAWAGAGQVIFSFEGDEGGEYPSTELVVDGAGYLYGTSVLGGDYGAGTVFSLWRSGSTWIHTVLYSFRGGLDGGQPYGGVTLDAQGNLYGTAVVGGTGGACEDGCGVAYKLTKSGSTYSHSVLHNFTGGADGSGPGQGLSFDSYGNLYGMTAIGGQYGLGVVYQLRPTGDGTYGFGVVHAFTGGDDGSSGSAGRLLIDQAGAIYGAATTGGAHAKGTVFRIKRQGGNWQLTTLYSFKGQPDAGFPYGGLNFDAYGNLYGTTYYDGAYNLGSVYQLHPTAQGEWKERVLYSFKGGADGANSISNLVFDASGNLYGTTSEGGFGGCSCGTIFKLSPAGAQWTESVAYRFRGTPDGAFPYNGMVADAQGNFYGSTVHGGVDNEGSIYQFRP